MTSYKLINSDIKCYNLPRTPRTPKGILSPKFIYKWENFSINDNLTQQNSKHFNCVETLINSDLPKTPYTPKGNLSPKINYKWSISFFN
jgi:hypothetical protein